MVSRATGPSSPYSSPGDGVERSTVQCLGTKWSALQFSAGGQLHCTCTALHLHCTGTCTALHLFLSLRLSLMSCLK